MRESGVAGAEVRLLVVEPTAGACGASAALARLGPDVRVEVLRDAEAAASRARAGDVDLVVADTALGPAALRLLDALRRDGPPVILAAARMADADAVAGFRRGAADCVSLRGAGDELLPLAALEQIQRRRAARERAARESRIDDLEHVSRGVIQNMNSAVLVCDAEGRVLSCNASAEHILGRPAASLEGESARDWFRDAAGRGIVERCVREGVGFKGAETAVLRPDGARVPIGISCAPIAGAGGERRGAVATFQDLTEMRQLQAQALHAEKMASIGQLAAGVAHEINNPVGFIHANLSQLAEYVADLRRVWERVAPLQKAAADSSEPGVRAAADALAAESAEVDLDFVLADLGKAVRESLEGAERIRHIVQDLRTFSHPDRGDLEKADVNQCLDSTASIVWPMMKHLVVLEKHYRDLPPVRCYPMQLKQVFMNLLVNAYQAIEEALAGRHETGCIELRTERRGDCVVVSVSDTGVGIPPEQRDRIFDPFYTTKKVGAGTGLGLSTSYSIVRRHGGTLEVESEPGKGTTIRVVLPLDGAVAGG